jgi:hypothetical protein
LIRLWQKNFLTAQDSYSSYSHQALGREPVAPTAVSTIGIDLGKE